MLFVFIASVIITIIILSRKNIPFIPFDKINKLQSINKKNIQLSLFLIPLPIILFDIDFNTKVLILSALFVGILDDKYSLSVKVRFISITLFLSIYTFFEKYYINFDIVFFDNRLILSIITIILILGFIHTINMIDGKNGFTILIFFNLFLYICLKKFINNDISQIDILLLAILIIILFINLFDIAYLGNTGVILLSLYFSYILIDLYNFGKLSEKEIYCLLNIPFLDGLRVTLSRILRNKNPFMPDKNHLHHLIKNWNYGLIFIFLSLLFMSYIAFTVNYHFLIILFISLLNYYFLYMLFKKN